MKAFVRKRNINVHTYTRTRKRIFNFADVIADMKHTDVNNVN